MQIYLFSLILSLFLVLQEDTKSFYFQQNNTIENKINFASDESLKNKNEITLNEIGTFLTINNIDNYWMAYYSFIYSNYFKTFHQNKKAEQKLQEGIRILKNKKNKDSEDYALLSLLSANNIEYVSFFNKLSVFNEAKKYALKSIKLNKDNPRAHFMLGSIDYYTPSLVGGGKETEKHLINSLNYFNSNTSTPSWGEKKAYELLILYYIENEQWELAQEKMKLAIVKFPTDKKINELNTKIEQHNELN